MRYSPLLFLLLLFPVSTHATTYYIDWGSGSDANSGTSKSTPWKRAPGMQGSADVVLAYETSHTESTNTDAAGDSFIFKGGVTWPNSCYSWVWRWGGGTGWVAGTSAVYFGVDATWYVGTAWARPVFDAGGIDVTANTKSSPETDNTMLRIYKSSGGYYTVDNLEFKGMAHLDDNEDRMLVLNANVGEIKNCYFHGWTRGGTATQDNFRVIATSYDTESLDTMVHHNIIDGADSSPIPGDMANATKGYIGHFYNNYIANVQNVLTNSFVSYVWGNTIKNLATVDDFDTTAHHNMYQSYGGAGKKSYVYNNYSSDVSGGATYLLYPTDSTLFYIFNNIAIGDLNQTLQLSSGELTTASNTAGFNIWNNTLQLDVSNDFAPINGSSSGYPVSVFSVKNNHIIANNSTISDGVNTAVESANLQQTNSAASSAGYVDSSTYPYAPQTDTGSGVDVGDDLSSICDGLVDYAPSYPSVSCMSDTTAGVEYDSVNHVILGDNRDAFLRGTAWDIGAYEYQQQRHAQIGAGTARLSNGTLQIN